LGTENKVKNLSGLPYPICYSGIREKKKMARASGLCAIGVYGGKVGREVSELALGD